jgi:hypothetical protein
MSTNRSNKLNNSSSSSKLKQNEDVDFLLKTVEEQNEQITRLQTKFRG